MQIVMSYMNITYFRHFLCFSWIDNFISCEGKGQALFCFFFFWGNLYPVLLTTMKDGNYIQLGTFQMCTLSFKVVSELVAKLYHDFVTVYCYFRLLNIQLTDCLTPDYVFT